MLTGITAQAASAQPVDEGTVSASVVENTWRNCPLERIGDQLVRCDLLTGERRVGAADRGGVGGGVTVQRVDGGRSRTSGRTLVRRKSASRSTWTCSQVL
jgi:hypothetical protein